MAPAAQVCAPAPGGHLRLVRLAALFAAALLVAGTPAAARPATSFWSTAKVLRWIDGVHIRVGTRRVRLDGETTLCSGQGVSVRRRGVRLWRQFACTYTVFTRGFVDRDLDFRLHVLSATRFSVTDAHWVRASADR